MPQFSDYDRWKLGNAEERLNTRHCDDCGEVMCRDTDGHFYCSYCQSVREQALAERDKYLDDHNISPAVKKAMRRFWKRLDEVDAEQKRAIRAARVKEG